MKTLALFPIALALSFAANTQAATPPAPTLTAGGDFKGLRFDWDKVPDASWYQLELRSHQIGSFSQLGDDYPASSTSARLTFPLHLFDWTYARYRLGACNSAGCTYSSEVSVSNLRRDAVGYFKSSQPEAHSDFGNDTDMSSDGYTFVAAAPGEGDTTPGDEYIDGGAAYVFHRGSDGKWMQRARLSVNNHAFYMGETNFSVATSGSGNTIAVGLGNLTNDTGGGEVDVYYAKPGSGSYSRKRIPRPDGIVSFGKTVALSESGYVLAVGTDDLDTRVIIYKSVNGVWQRVRDLPVEGPVFCYTAQLSRDGKTIAQHCDQWKTATTPRRSLIRVHSGSNWSVQTDIDLEVSDSENLEWVHSGYSLDATGDTIAVQFFKYETGTSNGTALIKVYKRGTAGYSQVATLTPGAWRTNRYGYEYGTRLSLSGDGHTLAVADTYDNGTGSGPRAAPLVSGSAQLGAVYVYRLTDSWKLANMVKPNFVPETWMEGYFGRELAISQTGRTLIVSMPADSSASSGIDGDWSNTDLPFSGGVFMY
jgi:hypothetical protein